MISKVVLIGKISDYQHNFNLINLQIHKELLNVVGIILEDSNFESVDNIQVYSSLSEIKDMEFDYFILLTEDNEFYAKISEENDFKQKIIPIRVFNIPNFDFQKYQKLLENPPSIISRHCWGGLIFHSLGLQFKSPFVNLYLNEFDFNKLAQNFSHYMNQELEFLQEGYDPILKSKYPIVKLGDLTIYFNHYSTFEEAKNNWEERKKRINYDNLFFETTTEYKSVAIQFNSLNLGRKLCFCVDDIKGRGMINCVDIIPEFSKGKLGMFVNGTANGEIPLFNIINLLLNYDMSFRINVPKKTNNERAFNYYKTTHLFNLESARLFGLGDEFSQNLDDMIESFNFADKLGVTHSKILYNLEFITDLKNINQKDLPSKFYLKSSKSNNNLMLLEKIEENIFSDKLTSKSYSIEDIVNEINSKSNNINQMKNYYLIKEVPDNFLEKNEIPIEYKVYSFNGIPKLILQVQRNINNPIVALFDGNFIPLKEGRDWFINKEFSVIGTHIIPPSAYEIISQSIKISKEIGNKYIITTWFDSGEEPIFDNLQFTSYETFNNMFSLSREILLNLNNSLQQELYADYIEKGYRIDSQKLHDVLNTELNFKTQEYRELLQTSTKGDAKSLKNVSDYFEKLSINEGNVIKKRLYQHLEIAWLENSLLYDQLSTEKLCRQINAGWGFVFLKTFYFRQRLTQSKEILFSKSEESEWYKIRWAQFIFDFGGTKEDINKAKNYVETYSQQGLDYAITVKNRYGL